MTRLKTVILVFFVFLITVGFSRGIFDFTAQSQSGTTPAAPTGVIASDGNYSTKVGIMWDTIRGATTYRVFRNTTNNANTATDIGTTVSNTFYDTTAVVNQNYFYWVKAENGVNASGFSSPEQGFRANGTIGPVPFPPLEPPPTPPGNPITATKIYLGKTLFWDEQLSSTRTVSCGTCHIPASGGSDPRSRLSPAQSLNPGFDNVFGTPDDVIGSIGVPQNNADGTYGLNPYFGFNEQVTGRKANPFIDAGYSSSLFWDGRAEQQFRDPITNSILLASGAALESQAAGPPVSAVEMAHQTSNWTLVANQIATSRPLALSPSVPQPLKTWINGRNYSQLFQEAYGSPDVTPAKIAMAIATYERSLFSDQTPLDKAMAQIEPLTPQEENGRTLFVNLQCAICHGGSAMQDNNFHNIGTRPVNEDKGRFNVTGLPEDQGRFKSPGLRNVELRAPFMRNGKFNTLEDVVEFYNRGGDFDAPNINRNVIRPLELSNSEKADLVAFMKRPLTDPRVANELPPFDRPTLYSESNRVPQIIGVGVNGSGNILPAVKAIEPPHIGNPSFTVGVFRALGGATATLVIDDNDPGAGPTIPTSGSFARLTIQLQGSGAGNGYGSISLPIPNAPALVGRTFTGRWYVNDSGAGNGVAVSRAFRFTIFADDAFVGRTKHADFDGDGKTDISVFRPSDGNWYILRSSNNSLAQAAFGQNGDLLSPADFDGDGRTDVSIYRSGTWYILRSRDGLQIVSFGINGDIPQPGDFDGDGKADVAVWRPSTGTWYVLQSRDGFFGANFGIAGDKPVAADYDGDGKTDIAVYRSGIWHLLRSNLGYTAFQFGIATDKPVFGDYDGDGKADAAVYRNGAWFVLQSSTGGFASIQFGNATDTPAPGDYDGDGKNDFAIFRGTEGNWYLNQSANGSVRIQAWGINQDRAVPGAFVP